MRASDARQVVEVLRRDCRLWLPSLTERRGFSSSRVEHLLNGLVRSMPPSECYLEVGVLEGRTLEAASVGNSTKRLVGIDPCEKYGVAPVDFQPNVRFLRKRWQELLRFDLDDRPVGVCFYDGDHSAAETESFMREIEPLMADPGVLVLDDWDRESVRMGAYAAANGRGQWKLVAEMPEYSDGLTCQPQRFGYSFGVSVWSFER